MAIPPGQRLDRAVDSEGCTATKRFKDGAWRFCVKRSKILPKPVYLTFDDEVEGDAYCARLEELLDRGIIPEELAARGARSLGQVVDEYLERNRVKPDDAALLERIGKRFWKHPIEKVSYVWAENWVALMKREDHLAPGTIRHYVGALARCLDWAVAREYLTLNPLRQLPKGYAQYAGADQEHVEARHDRELDRRLEPGEEERIRAQIDTPEMMLMFDLALETAMRLSEIYTLSWDQIDIDARAVRLERTKNGHKRQVPLSSVAVAALRAYPVKSGNLFPWGAKTRATSAMLSKRWGRLFEAAGASGLRFHCLRHEATSRLFERTSLSDVEIMKITGHSGSRMLARYANLRASDLASRLW